MSLQLYVAIDNARDQLEPVLPAYGAGELTDPWLPLGLGILFRQIGTCRMLVEGTAGPLFVGQMQAASAYLLRLPTLPENDKATSFAACWWDAIAGGYWEAARDIARFSRRRYNSDREHEDDFLYVDFLMHRYFLASDAADPASLALHQQEQSERLARWRTVLEGEPDPKLDLCQALQNHDREGFQEALVQVGQHRRTNLEERETRETLEPELALWMKPVWPEGLALLRLAELDGLGTEFDCPDVPSLIRVTPPFRYNSNAWRDLDFTPAPR